jgi:hypothetical protein
MIKWSGDIENYCNILPIFPPQGNNFIGNILLPGYEAHKGQQIFLAVRIMFLINRLGF